MNLVVAGARLGGAAGICVKEAKDRSMSMTTEAAPAAAIVTEPPRDLYNASADRQALGLVRPYLGMVAWPTVFLAIGIVASFILVSTLATMRIIPLSLGL